VIMFSRVRNDYLMTPLLNAVLQMLSNIVSVQVYQVDRDEKTWQFTNKVIDCNYNSEETLVFAVLSSRVSPQNRTTFFLSVQ